MFTSQKQVDWCIKVFIWNINNITQKASQLYRVTGTPVHTYNMNGYPMSILKIACS